MIQTIRIQSRSLLLAFAALALAVFVTFSLPPLTSSPQAAAIPDAPVQSLLAEKLALAEQPLVPVTADRQGCGSGTYVSGDLAGDASPAEIYATLCGGR